MVAEVLTVAGDSGWAVDLDGAPDGARPRLDVLAFAAEGRVLAQAVLMAFCCSYLEDERWSMVCHQLGLCCHKGPVSVLAL